MGSYISARGDDDDEGSRRTVGWSKSASECTGCPTSALKATLLDTKLIVGLSPSHALVICVAIGLVKMDGANTAGSNGGLCCKLPISRQLVDVRMVTEAVLT